MEKSQEKQTLLNDDEKEKKSSVFSTYMNYINSIIGSGVIGMAYAVSESGWLLSVILLFIVALLTDYSLILVVKCGLISGTSSYQVSPSI